MSENSSAKRGALAGPGGSYYPDNPRFRSFLILPPQRFEMQATSEERQRPIIMGSRVVFSF